MAKDVLITPASAEIKWSDTGTTKATITEVNGDIVIDPVSGNLVIGDGSPSNIEVGNSSVEVSFTFLGGGQLSSDSNELSIGISGDTINLDVTGVTYNWPASLVTTSDYTASDILTKIKTVDGAGSGLDADLLDGQHGSYYTNYTDTSIANLIDSAPGTLNTLNELAAALGDDANFSTTITNSIATKLPLAGGTMTGNLEIQKNNPVIILDDSTSSSDADTTAYISFQQIGTEKGWIGWGSNGDTKFTVRNTIGDVVLYPSSNTNAYVHTNQIFTDGYHPNADKWTTSRTLTLSGDATGSVSWDGSADATLSVTVADDSHSHAFNNLTGKTSGTGDYATTGDLVSGKGSGGVALTVNDGYGNANVTWNHQDGVPEQAGNAARIEVNTDSTSGAAMYFELLSNVTANTAVQTSSAFTLTETYGMFHGSNGIYLNDTNTKIAEGSGNSVRITTDSGYLEIGPQNTGWAHLQTDRAAFYFNTDVAVNGTLKPYADSTDTLGTSTYRWSNIYGDAVDIESASSTNLVIRNSTNAGGAGIDFSDHAGSYAQKGYFQFYHSDSASPGSAYGATFKFSTTETSLAVINTGEYFAGSTNRVFHDGYHPNADKWTTARTITLAGDATGSVSLDGSADVTLTVAVANDSHTHDTRYVRKDSVDNGSVDIVVNDADFIVRDTTDSTTNFIWRDHSASKLYLGTSAAVTNFRSDIEANVDGSQNIGSDSTRFRNIRVGTTNSGYIYRGWKVGASYSDGTAIYGAVLDNATGTASYLFDGYSGGTSGTKTFHVRGDGQGYFAGDVGIGTTAPEGKLHVKGGTTRMEVQAVTNGVVSSNMSSLIEATEAQLQILGEDSGTWGSNIVLTNAPSSGSNRHWTVHHNPSTHPTAPKALAFRYQETNTVGQIGGDGSGATSETKMVILYGGNVGIGTDTPDGKLHVYTGNAGTITTNSSHDDVIIEGNGNVGLNFFSPNTSYQYIAFGDPESANSGYVRYYHGSNQMVLRAGGDTVYINDGNVGIGVASPGTTLDVNGTARATQFRLASTGVIDDATATTTATTQVAIDAFSTSAYGGSKLLIEAKTGSNRHITELLVTHDGTTAVATEYGAVYTSGVLATYDVDISGGNVRILATPASSTSTSYKVMRTTMFA